MRKVTSEDIREVMAELGRRGGPKGGAARALALTAKRRKAIATQAARARWAKKKEKGK